MNDKSTAIQIIKAIMVALEISIHEIFENDKTKLIIIEK
jgi:hypothetical protein